MDADLLDRCRSMSLAEAVDVSVSAAPWLTPADSMAVDTLRAAAERFDTSTVGRDQASTMIQIRGLLKSLGLTPASRAAALATMEGDDQ